MSLQAALGGGEFLRRVEVREGGLVWEVSPPAAEFVHQALERRLARLAGELRQALRNVDAPERAKGMTAKGARRDHWVRPGDGNQPGAQIGGKEGGVARRGEAVTAPFGRRPGEGASDAGQRTGWRPLQVCDGREAKRRGEFGRSADRQSGASGTEGFEAPGDQGSTSQRLARLVATEPARSSPRKHDAGDVHATGPADRRRSAVRRRERRSGIGE